LVPDWRPTPRQGLWAIRGAIVLGALIATGYAYGITLWEWAKLLIVPAAIAGAGLWFNQQQREREVQIADQRANTDREIADQRRQDDTLQAYLDQIGELLLDKALRESKEVDEVRSLALVRTLTVLPRLDGERKGIVLQFLHRSGLITKGSVILDLNGADFSGITLRTHLSLNSVSLRSTNLSDCRLAGASITNSDLNNANLANTDLSAANLYGTDFRAANLTGTIFARAELYNADFSGGTPGRAAFTLEAVEANARRAAQRWLKTLAEAQFEGAWYSSSTKWPQGFDRRAAGARYNEGV
jgi:hypothetical protein